VRKIFIITSLFIFLISLKINADSTGYPNYAIEERRHNIQNFDKRSRDMFEGMRRTKIRKESSKVREKIVISALKPVNVDIGLADAVMENLLYQISSQKIFLVVDRIALSRKMNDYTEDFIIKQGELIEATFGIFGSITRLGEKFSINIQLINIETREVAVGMNLIANSESDLFRIVKDISTEVTKNEEILKKYRKDLKKVVIFDFKPINIDKSRSIELAENMIFNISDFGKYWAIESKKLIKLMKTNKIPESEIYTQETALKMAALEEADLVFFGEIKKEGDKIIVDAKAADVKTGTIKFRKIISTKFEYQIPLIGDRLVYLASTLDKKSVSDEEVNIDLEKYEIIYKKSRKFAFGLLGSGLAMTGLGLGVTAGGFACLGAYLHLNYTNQVTPENRLLTAAAIALLCIGTPLATAGIILSCVSPVFFLRAKKYKRLADQEKISYYPIIDFSFNDVQLGMGLKF